MPSPEFIDLTLSDDETQPDPTRSIQDSSTPTPATNRFRTSSSTPPTSGINRTQRILPVIQGTFAAIERAENYLPLQLIQFPPEMDKNWVRDGLAKLGQICELPNWQRIVVLCIHNTTSALNS